MVISNVSSYGVGDWRGKSVRQKSCSYILIRIMLQSTILVIQKVF